MNEFTGPFALGFDHTLLADGVARRVMSAGVELNAQMTNTVVRPRPGLCGYVGVPS